MVFSGEAHQADPGRHRAGRGQAAAVEPPEMEAEEEREASGGQQRRALVM